MRGATTSAVALLAALDASYVAPFGGAAYASQPPRCLYRGSKRSRCTVFGSDGRSINAIRSLRCGGAAAAQPRSISSLLMIQSGGGVKAERKSSTKYHLIWSPNFMKKMALSALLLMAAQYALKKNAAGFMDVLLSKESHSCHGWRGGIPTVVLPLLSSSCCAIQLAINAFSGWGCAGFNTYLGPIRPFLLPVLLLSTWHLLTDRSIAWTITSLLLGFLPEIVDITNNVRSQRWQRKGSGFGATYQSTVTGSQLPLSATLRLHVPTMGCVACINKIDTSIRQSKVNANICEEASWLNEGSSEKGGRAELSISGRTDGEIDRVVEEVVAAVKNAGFECVVESLRR